MLGDSKGAPCGDVGTASSLDMRHLAGGTGQRVSTIAMSPLVIVYPDPGKLRASHENGSAPPANVTVSRPAPGDPLSVRMNKR